MIHVNNSRNISMSKRDIEIVERKGFGHPDTICDNIVNHVAEVLKKKYIEECGGVHHYNLDKALLTAGVGKVDFGKKYRLSSPIKLLIGDRASHVREFNVHKYIQNTAKDWWDENFEIVNEKDIFIRNVSQPGSSALVDIFNRGQMSANDTSATVGYAPFSDLERIVCDVETTLQRNRDIYPCIGQDIKVMGYRNRDKIDLTVAIAMIAEHINSVDEYVDAKADILADIKGYLVTGEPDFDFSIKINALDNYVRGIDGLYLTNTGLSAESADSGQVGRGNNPLGVIPLNRPMSAEAEAGKNDVSHVGKIYNNLCYELADDIYKILYPEVEEVYVWMLSEIGKPLNEPKVVSVEVVSEQHSDSFHEIISSVIGGKVEDL
jgi:S-adenosylmethionine synthetase